VSVPVHEELIQANRERVHTPELRPLLQIRRQRGEAPFGYFKQFGGLRRFAGRGLSYALKKTLMAAVGWNLLRLLAHGASGSALRLAFLLLIGAIGALWVAPGRRQRRFWRLGRFRPRRGAGWNALQTRLPGFGPMAPLSGAC
jgi:hypothetical protein